MATISVSDVIELIGGSLRDDGDEKDRFRQFVSQDKWTPDDFRAWIKECCKCGSQNRVLHLALQDIVISIGERLGFQVEYGRYAGSRNEIAYDGRWSLPKTDDEDVEQSILVEVKASAWPVDNIGQLGVYVDRYAEEHQVSSEVVNGLYVICAEDFGHLVNQIRGSDYRNQLRLVGATHLIRLWEMKLDLDQISQQGEARVQSLLLPIEAINVGSLVDLLDEIAILKGAVAIEDQATEEEEAGTEKLPWKKDELLRFLGSNTSWQNAVLACLTLGELEEVRTKQLLAMANRFAHERLGVAEGESLKNISGVLGGFTMRRGEKEDFLETRWSGQEGCCFYKVRESYRTWLVEWVRDKGYEGA